jgi:hypothetical protein
MMQSSNATPIMSVTSGVANVSLTSESPLLPGPGHPRVAVQELLALTTPGIGRERANDERRQFGPDLRQRRARREPAQQQQPDGPAIVETALMRPEHIVDRDGQPDVCRRAHHLAREELRRYADDREPRVVDDDRLADDPGILIEALRPVAVADGCNR